MLLVTVFAWNNILQCHGDKVTPRALLQGCTFINMAKRKISWPEPQHDECNIILEATDDSSFNHYIAYNDTSSHDVNSGGVIFTINAKEGSSDLCTWRFNFTSEKELLNYKKKI